MDRSELERELERLHPESWGWALACCGRDHERAEEALQTAYLRVVTGAARFDGRSSFKTWVFGVIRVTALGQARRWRLWRSRTEDTGRADLVPDPTPGGDVTAERSERNAELARAVAGLSPRQREILQLVFYHGLTVEESARVMKVSLGSARTHYDRAKKALRRSLDREDVR